MKKITLFLVTFLSLQSFSQQLTSYNFSGDGFDISASFPRRPSKDFSHTKDSKTLTLTATEDGVTYALIVTKTGSAQIALQAVQGTVDKIWAKAGRRDMQQPSYAAGVSSTMLKYVSEKGAYVISHTFASGVLICQAMVLQKNNYANEYMANNFFTSVSFSGYVSNNQTNYNQPPSNSGSPYEKNQRVEVWDAKNSKWYGAIVLKVNANKTYRISYDGYADNYDEDLTADRIRKATTATVPANIPYIVLKRFGKTNIDGNLSSGYIMEDLSWATTSQLACWPSIRDVEFQGKHVGYWFDLPEKSIVKITVTPKRKDRRINIYGYAGFDLKTIPPQIPYTNICEASHSEWIGQPDFNVPSKPQTIQFNTTTRRTTIYFAVAGARNMFDGDYTISIDID